MAAFDSSETQQKVSLLSIITRCSDLHAVTSRVSKWLILTNSQFYILCKDTLAFLHIQSVSEVLMSCLVIRSTAVSRICHSPYHSLRREAYTKNVVVLQ